MTFSKDLIEASTFLIPIYTRAVNNFPMMNWDYYLRSQGMSAGICSAYYFHTHDNISNATLEVINNPEFPEIQGNTYWERTPATAKSREEAIRLLRFRLNVMKKIVQLATPSK